MESQQTTRNTCAAVIPCFDEAQSIAEVLVGTLRHVGRVWVVDDGSADATRSAAEGAGAEVIRREVNLGKGAALREGLEAARGAGFEWAVTLDGDGQHDPDEIPKLIEAARGGADTHADAGQAAHSRGAAILGLPKRAARHAKWVRSDMAGRGRPHRRRQTNRQSQAVVAALST